MTTDALRRGEPLADRGVKCDEVSTMEYDEVSAMKVAASICLMRTARGLDEAELAGRAGVSAEDVALIETGEFDYAEAALAVIVSKIASALGKTPEGLLTFYEEEIVSGEPVEARRRLGEYLPEAEDKLEDDDALAESSLETGATHRTWIPAVVMQVLALVLGGAPDTSKKDQA